MPPSGLGLRYILATALLGDHEGVESVLLSDIFSEGGSRNTFIDKFGRTGQILGYTQQNAAAVVTNVGGNATRLRGLFHYANSAAGVLTRQEIGIFDDAVAHWEFRKSIDIGATWTFVADLGVGSINRIPDFAQSGSLLFTTNGVIAPRQWDGTTLTTAGSTQLAAPTFTSTGAGVLVGNIAWRILPMVGNARKLSSVQSANFSIVAATGAGHVDWIADPDVTVTGYEVYRTSGTGSIFYVEGYVDGRLTVTFNVGAATDTDANLIQGRVLQEFGDPPPVGAYFCELHQQRMFYIRTDTDPRRAYFADPGLPYSVYKAFHFIDFTDAEAFSDISTGATGDFEQKLVMWLERSVWTLSGTGELIGNVRDYVRKRTDAQIGCVTHRTVARVPAGSKYLDNEGQIRTTTQNMLAYFTPLMDIRLFDGNNDTIISTPKQDTLGLANYAQRNKFFCAPDRVRGEVTWVFASGSSTEPNQAITWNYKHGTWYNRDWPFAHAVEAESSSSSSFLLAGEADLAIGGLCYLLWNGYTRNGNQLMSQWESKTLYATGNPYDAEGYFGKPLIGFRKRWRYADLLLDVVSGSVTFQLEWVVGDDPSSDAIAYSTLAATLPTSELTTVEGSIITTSDASTLLVSAPPSLIRVKSQNAAGRFMHSRGARLRLSATTNTGQWFLNALAVAYQLLPGRKRSIGVIP